MTFSFAIIIIMLQKILKIILIQVTNITTKHQFSISVFSWKVDKQNFCEMLLYN